MNTKETNTGRATLATLGELRSKKLQDVMWRVHHDGPQILEQVKEWRKHMVDARHPAAHALFAAGVLMQDMFDLINRQEQELQSWQAFAEQSNQRNDELRTMTTVCVVRSGDSSDLEVKV